MRQTLRSLNLNNVNLDDDIFDDYDPEIISHIRLLTWQDKFKEHKACKKEISKQLLPVAWRLTRWRVGASKRKKKKIEPFLIDENQCNVGGRFML